MKRESHPSRETLLLLISLIAWASPAAGQAVSWGPRTSVLLINVARGPLSVDWSAESQDTVTRDIRPTHWKEGALVGALVGAAGGALVGVWACGMSDEIGKDCTGTTILAGVGGAVLMAIPGALVGGQFPKGGRTDGRTEGQAD
jgi:hypothetical protein